MIEMKNLIYPAVSFVNSIKPKSKVVIVHGHDADSICSAAIMYKLIKLERKINSNLLISELNSHLREKTFEKIKRMKPSYVIIVDIANISVEIITKMREFSNVMIIDHHIPKGYVKITYVNPRVFEREIYLPATYVCYKIYEDFSNTKDIAWIAGIGTLGDMGMKNCPDLFNKIKNEYAELVDDFEQKDEILIEKSLLGKLTKTMDSGMVVKDVLGSIFALKVLIGAKKYKDVLNNVTLSKYYKLVDEEFKKIEGDFEKNKKIVGSLVMYEIKSKLKLKSAFSSKVQRLFNDKIIVIYRKEMGYYDISLRKGKNVRTDLDALGKEAALDIDGANGGGHPNAAGMRVPIKYIKHALDNLKIKVRLEPENKQI
jgi:single-stranded DNA-specific DHH superfamily exonuclease